MSTLNYKNQLLFAGGLFTLHNIEESIGFSKFVYPRNLPLAIRPQNATAMILAIGLITVIAWGLILWANIHQKEINRKNLLIMLVSVFLVNAFFPHIIGTIFLQRYFPAVITSIVLYIPYSCWILPKLYRTYPKHDYFYQIVIAGLLLGSCLVIILHFFVRIFLQFIV
jgi:hypothetical protein